MHCKVIMAREVSASEMFMSRLFEQIRVPFVIVDPNFVLVLANRFAREVLPFDLQEGEVLNVDRLLQHEDSADFNKLITECRERGESVGTVKEKIAEKYYKVRAYSLENKNGEIALQFEDISQSRNLEDQFYEHLVDLYNQLETQEREIATLRAKILHED